MLPVTPLVLKVSKAISQQTRKVCAYMIDRLWSINHEPTLHPVSSQSEHDQSHLPKIRCGRPRSAAAPCQRLGWRAREALSRPLNQPFLPLAPSTLPRVKEKNRPAIQQSCGKCILPRSLKPHRESLHACTQAFSEFPPRQGEIREGVTNSNEQVCDWKGSK